MDIIFVHQNTPWGTFEGFVPHYGAAQLISVLRSRGFAADFYISSENKSVAEHAKEIVKHSPRFVGFSCYDSQFPVVVQLAEIIKRLDPNIHTVLGGPTATNSHKWIIGQYSSIDYCLRGESEAAIVELLGDSQSNNDLFLIKNLTFRYNDAVVANALRPTLTEKQMNMVPSPYLSRVIDVEEAVKIGVMTSRGCVFHCTYCNFSTLTGRQLRYYDLDRVVEEIVTIDRYFLDRNEQKILQIVDEAFTTNKKRTMALLNRIIRKGVSITLSCMSRADFVDDEIVKKLADAGFQYINFGLESANNEVLYNVKKARMPANVSADTDVESRFKDSVKRAIRLTKKYNLNTNVSMIAGLPGENEERLEETLDFIRHLDVNYMHNTIQCFEGTKLFEESSKFGIDVLPNSFWRLPYVTIPAFNVTNVPPIRNRAQNLKFAKRESIKTMYKVISGMVEANDVVFPDKDSVFTSTSVPMKSVIMFKDVEDLDKPAYWQLQGFRVLCFQGKDKGFSDDTGRNKNADISILDKDKRLEPYSSETGFSIGIYPWSWIFRVEDNCVRSQGRSLTENMKVVFVDKRFNESEISALIASGEPELYIDGEESNVIVLGAYTISMQDKEAVAYIKRIGEFLGVEDCLELYESPNVRRFAFLIERALSECRVQRALLQRA